MKSLLKFACFKKTAVSILAASVFTAASLALPAAPAAFASGWELFDKGEHIVLPEGPFEDGSVLMVPLRPIAERFGYRVASAGAAGVELQGGAIGRVLLKTGSDKVVMNGTVTHTIERAPQIIRGTLFIPLSFVGELTDIGYSVVPGTKLIQLRPVEGDALPKLNAYYLFSVRTDKGYSFIDNTGRQVVETTYQTVNDFGYDELTPAYYQNQGIGYIDRTGKLAVRSAHYRLEKFSEGLAVFKEWVQTSEYHGVQMGFIDRTGKTVIPAKFSRAYSFSEGLAKVVDTKGKTFYIDHNGRTVIKPITGVGSTGSFSEGLAVASKTVNVGGKYVQRTGYIDKKGQFVIPPKFEWGGPFSDGRAVVYQNGAYGVIDARGGWIVKPDKELTWIEDFHEGYAVATVKSAGKRLEFLLDKSGKRLTFPGVTDISTFSEGLLGFEQDGKWGYKNIKGETVIPPRFDWAAPFESGAARVNVTTNKDGSYSPSLIDRTGKLIWTEQQG
jgi:hypothetical protein